MTPPLRVLQVGCGGISELWLEAAVAMPDVEVVGLVDVVEENARAKAARFGLTAPTGTDLGAMLAATRPEVVFDCTVPEAHHGVTLRALRAGCHVFGEKPMADTLAEAREMIAVAAATGRTYAVMQNRRFDPAIRRLKALLDEGAIGTLTTVNADFYLGAHFGGFRERMRHVLIKDMAIHTFDAARYLTSQDARSVYCHEWNPVGSWYDHDASAMAIFEMSGGVVFGYRGSWCSEGLHTPWESEWRLVGTGGSVRWDGADEIRCEVVVGGGGFLTPKERRDPVVPERSPSPSLHARAIRDFVDAVRSGRTPETVCADNIRSLAMVLAACASAEQGRRLAVDPEAGPEPG